MSSLDTEVVYRLLSQHSFKAVPESSSNELTCVICKKFMIDAYQSSCGCQYCYKCLVSHLSIGNAMCKGGKEECKDGYLELDKNIFKSALLNRKISKVKVLCPNEPCSYVNELALMEPHLRMCSKQSIECPYVQVGCDYDKATKDAILSHLHSDTLPHTELLIEWIHNLRNELDLLKDDFAARKLEIEYLKEDSKLKDIELEKQKKEIENMKKESINGAMILMKMKTKIAMMRKEMKGMQENTSNIKFDVTTMEEETTCGQRVKVQSPTNTTVKSDSTKVVKIEHESMVSVLSRVNKLEEVLKGINIGTNRLVAIGTQIVTVNNFRSQKTTNEYIHSPHFYSHTNGYKFQLLVYPGGNLDGSGTHLSVFIYICRGEYDDLISWPCRHSINVSVVNQHNGDVHYGQNLRYDSASDNLKYTYYKPIDEDNVGNGYSQFISHVELLTTKGLVVNDSVLIKCTVCPPT